MLIDQYSIYIDATLALVLSPLYEPEQIRAYEIMTTYTAVSEP